MKKNFLFSILFFLILFSEKTIAQNLIENGNLDSVYHPNTSFTTCTYNDLKGNWIFLGVAETHYQRKNDSLNVRVILDFMPTHNPGRRSFLETKLNFPLCENDTCQLSFSINSSGYMVIDRIGAYFSDSLITIDSVEHVIPQILTPTNKFYRDSGFTKINLTYIARGGEQYLTIGNFISKNKAHYKIYPKNKNPGPGFYLIDNISLYDACHKSESTFRK